MYCPSNHLIVASDWKKIDRNCDLTPANTRNDAFIVQNTVMGMQPLKKQPTETLTKRHLNSCESCFLRSNKDDNKIMNMSRLYSVKIKHMRFVFCYEQKLIELNTFTNISTAFSFSDLGNWNHINLDLKWIKLSYSLTLINTVKYTFYYLSYIWMALSSWSDASIGGENGQDLQSPATLSDWSASRLDAWQKETFSN